MDKLRESIESWENLKRKYEERKKKTLDDDISRSCLQQMCPVKLQDHLDLQSSRLTSYDLMKSEILAYIENVESRRKEAKTGGAPMDIDFIQRTTSQLQSTIASLAKAKGKSKSKDKGTGKGKSKEKILMKARPTKGKERARVKARAMVHGQRKGFQIRLLQ